MSCVTPSRGLPEVLGHEPLDDLRLEDDVRQALRGPVVHLAGDLAAHVLLGGEDHPGHARRQRAVRLDQLGLARPALAAAAAARHRPRAGSPATTRACVGVRRDRLVEPDAGLALALEEVDLGLHQGGLARDRDELVGELRELLGVRPSPAASRSAAIASFSLAADLRGLVARGLGLRLVDQELDLVDLALDGLRPPPRGARRDRRPR